MRCFSSPGSPRTPMDSAHDGPCGPGFPIRRSTDQSLLTAPRGLSQRATSFIASRRQGIHQTPFSARDPHPQTACRQNHAVLRRERGRLGEDSHAPPPLPDSTASPSQSGNTSCASTHDMPKPMPIDHVRNNAARLYAGQANRRRRAGACLLETWWSRTGSNRRPPACKAGALPTELRPLPGRLPPPRGGKHGRQGRRARDNWWAWIDLNYRPHPYQGCALTD